MLKTRFPLKRNHFAAAAITLFQISLIRLSSKVRFSTSSSAKKPQKFQTPGLLNTHSALSHKKCRYASRSASLPVTLCARSSKSRSIRVGSNSGFRCLLKQSTAIMPANSVMISRSVSHLLRFTPFRCDGSMMFPLPPSCLPFIVMFLTTLFAARYAAVEPASRVAISRSLDLSLGFLPMYYSYQMY